MSPRSNREKITHGYLLTTALAFAILVGPASAATLSGRVADGRGLPVSGVRLQALSVGERTDIADRLGTTDGDGRYSFWLPPGLYTIRFLPPAGGRLVAVEERDVNLFTDRTLDETLQGGWAIFGKVLRQDTGGPAVNVDLDFEDLVTGNDIFTPGDDTDANGEYSVIVPEGLYNVTFDGPNPGGGGPPLLAHGLVEEVSVCADTGLPTVTLPPGFRVTGLAADGGANPVEGANPEFRVSGSGEPEFTKKDESDDQGEFESIVRAGTYDVVIFPPFGSSLTSATVASVVVSADVDLGTVILAQGISLTGSVVDPEGATLREVDLDVFTSSGGEPVPIPFDRTDRAGSYSIHLPDGTYDIDFTPLVNSLVDPATESSVHVDRPTVLPVELDFHDEDGDGVPDALDRCPLQPDGQEDFDGDGVGSLCDNCPLSSNPRQENNDGTGGGDACDPDDDNDNIPDFTDSDRDGDSIINSRDNCPGAANPGQEDLDGDGEGDACDPDDGMVELIEAKNQRTFFWRPESGPLGYRVYRQRLSWLSKINYGVCAHDAPGDRPLLHDDGIPPAGDGHGYLATAEMPGGEGSLGRSSDGVERPNLRACP